MFEIRSEKGLCKHTLEPRTPLKPWQRSEEKKITLSRQGSDFDFDNIGALSSRKTNIGLFNQCYEQSLTKHMYYVLWSVGDINVNDTVNE